jgi:hypothetical protein
MDSVPRYPRSQVSRHQVYSGKRQWGRLRGQNSPDSRNRDPKYPHRTVWLSLCGLWAKTNFSHRASVAEKKRIPGRGQTTCKGHSKRSWRSGDNWRWYVLVLNHTHHLWCLTNLCEPRRGWCRNGSRVKDPRSGTEDHPDPLSEAIALVRATARWLCGACGDGPARSGRRSYLRTEGSWYHCGWCERRAPCVASDS